MTAKMCDLNRRQMLKGLPVMLDGPALTYFASNLNSVETYEAAIEGLVLWYTSEEQRTRLLREWQDARLTAWMRKTPEKSEISVFPDLSATLARIQRQLHPDYRKDRFLKDQLVAAVDIPHVAKALKEKAPVTAHEATQRIASLLSNEPNCAGKHAGDTDNAFYGLRQRYRGHAERNVGHGGSKGRFQRSSSKKRLAKIKGCWVCGANHMAHKFHSRDDIQKALEQHKKTGAYVSAEDVISVLLAESEESSSSDLAALDDDDGADSSAYLVEEILDLNEELEMEMSNKAFLYTCGFSAQRRKDIERMNRELGTNERRSEFNGVLIDTGANRTSLMSLRQYRAYCREHGTPAHIDMDSKRVCGLGGSTRSIGKATITLPCPCLSVVTDIDFHIIEEDVPTLLSLRELKRNGVDLSIQKDCLTLSHILRKRAKDFIGERLLVLQVVT